MKEEPTLVTQILNYGWEGFIGLLTLFFGWMFKQVDTLKKDSKRQDKMIYELEKHILKNYVSTEMFNKGVKELKDSHKEHRVETNEKLDKIYDKLMDKG